MGALDDDSSPLHNLYKSEQEAVLNDLAERPVVPGDDVEGSGLGGVKNRLRPVKNKWAIAIMDWRGAVDPGETAQDYLESRQSPLSLEAIIHASTLGVRLVSEYGEYTPSDRAAHEYMMRKRVSYSMPLLK